MISALKSADILEPTDVQAEAIPKLLSGKDAVIRAKTGTGKTLAFLIPIIQIVKGSGNRHTPILLALAPTRELALQISSVASKLIDRRRIVTVYGGSSINMQVDSLRRGADIVIGTPGRIIDLIERKALKIDAINHLVIDEADVMMDMGFIDDVNYIIERTPSDKQTVILSATMPREIIDISKRHMRVPEIISVGDPEEVTVKSIKHLYSIANGTKKFYMLLAYIEKYKPEKAIIFLQTKREADILHSFLLENKYDASLMHGGLTQARRGSALSRFKQGGRFLIATNVASRGLDISDISDVINFDVPDSPSVYVHRVGRSARMGKNGRAFSIVTREQTGIIRDIEFEARVNVEKIFLETGPYEHIPIDLHKHSRHSFDRRGGYDRGGDRGNRRSSYDNNRRGGWDRGGQRRRSGTGFGHRRER